MKKILTCAGVAWLAIALAMAQNASESPRGFYGRLVGGFSFSTAKTEMPGLHTMQQIQPSTGQTVAFSEEGLYGSYGGGGKAGLAFGYRFNRVFSLEMGANYYQGSDVLREQTEVEMMGVGEFFFQQTGMARAMTLIPSIVMSTGNETGLSPYARFSFVVPVWGQLEINTDIRDDLGQLGVPGAVYAREDIVKPVKPQFGFEGAMGVLYPVSSKVSLFAEAEFRTLTVDGQSRETREYTASVGSETFMTLDDLPVGVTQGNFKEKLSASDNVKEFENGTENPNFDPNQPADELKPFANLNGFGFNFGLQFAF